MASELLAERAAGKTLYAVAIKNGLALLRDSGTLEIIDPANRADYAISLVASADPILYFGDFPTGAPAGRYSILVFEQVGVDPDADADSGDGSLPDFDWTGESELTTAPPGAYTSPSSNMIQNRTGVNPKMDGISSGQLDTQLLALLPDAETRTALAVGVTRFDAADLTAREVLALQISVSKRVGADYLRAMAAEIATGTNAPRKAELSSNLRDLAATLEAEAEVYDDLFRGVVTEDTEEEQLGTLETGVILTSSPNEYLDSFRPEWVGEAMVVTE